MTQIVDPFNSASWTEEEREYYTSVERAARDRPDMLISNGKPEHAAFLIKLFIANAQSKVRLVSGGLPLSYEGAAVFGSYYIIAAVLDLLSRPGTMLHVLVHGGLKDVDDIADHPLVWAAGLLKERDELRGTLKVQKLSDEWEETLKDRDMLWHWMTMDESAYRIEQDVTKPAAVANFGEPDYARALVRVFDMIVSDEEANEVIASEQP